MRIPTSSRPLLLASLLLAACSSGDGSPALLSSGPVLEEDFLGGGSKLPPSACGAVTDVGECSGNVARFCYNNKLVELDCSDGGASCSCGLNSDQLYDCVGTCSDGGAGGGGGAGPNCGGITFKVAACHECFEQSCCEQGLACVNSAACVALINCIIDCPDGDSACLSSCEQKHSGGLDALMSLNSCIVTDCAETCK